jgi:hypothetical protein
MHPRGLTRQYNLLIQKDLLWRRGWDSNPRALADKTLSRRPRYDHFGTSPFVTTRSRPFGLSSNLRAGVWRRLPAVALAKAGGLSAQRSGWQAGVAHARSLQTPGSV